jgi:hypothetical protein
MYTEVELVEWTGLPRAVLQKNRAALGVPVVSQRPVAYDAAGALKLLRAVGLEGTDQSILDWLTTRKTARLPRLARVLRSAWRNPRLMRAQITDASREVIRVRVKDASLFKVGVIVQVVPGDCHMWLIDPEWDPKKLRQARRGKLS